MTETKSKTEPTAMGLSLKSLEISPKLLNKLGPGSLSLGKIGVEMCGSKIDALSVTFNLKSKP